MVQVHFNKVNLGDITSLDEIDEEKVSKVVSSLNALQSLSLMISNYIEIGSIRMDNWKSEKTFYLFKCPAHGYQITYPTGYSDILQCLKCLREELGLDPSPRKAELPKRIEINSM